MSASREKQLRQEQIGQPDPKTAREAQQRKQEKRSNRLYAAIAIAFVVVISTVVYYGHVSSDLKTKLYVIAFLNFLMSLITFKY